MRTEANLKQAAADIQTKPPPGWYTDGNHPGRRWWDGDRWTDRYETPQAPPPSSRQTPTTGIATLGYVLALLLPIVGFVIGLALVAKDDRSATGVIVTSIVSGIVGVILLSSMATA